MNKRRYSDEERKEHAREYKRQYYHLHKQHMDELHKQWKRTHAEQVRAWQRNYYATHPARKQRNDLLNAKARERYKQQHDFLMNMSDEEFLIYIGYRKPPQVE